MSVVELYHREIEGTFAEGHSSNQRMAGIVKDSERRFEKFQAQQDAKKRKEYLSSHRWREYLASVCGEEYLIEKRVRIEKRVERVNNGYDEYNPDTFLAELRFLRDKNYFIL